MIFKVQQVLKIKTNFDLKIGPEPIKMPQHAPLAYWRYQNEYKSSFISGSVFHGSISSQLGLVLVRGDVAELKRHISVDYFECDVYSNEI